MKHSMLLMQVRQTKTAAKMMVAEVIISAHRVVSPQVRPAQSGRMGAMRICHFKASITVTTTGTTMQKTHTNSHQMPHGLTILPLKMTMMRVRALKIISKRRKMP